MKNPIPKSGLFVTPTLEQIANDIESLPKQHRATAYLVFMTTLNACNKLVEEMETVNE
jgi:hypothetical protein